MPYLVLCRDTPDSRDKRPKVRDLHLAHWKPLDEQGRIILAGPLTDFAGSVFVLDLASEQEVRDWLAHDPYFEHGVFESYELHPFKCVLPARTWGAG